LLKSWRKAARRLSKTGNRDSVDGMKVELTPETEAYIEERVRSGAFASASEFVEKATRRQMQEETWFEQKVIKGLQGQITPLTREDLQSVRNIVRHH
jgi:Arc/MetJ-type ribon-helix-helix transcriptional regulator